MSYVRIYHEGFFARKKTINGPDDDIFNQPVTYEFGDSQVQGQGSRWHPSPLGMEIEVQDPTGGGAYVPPGSMAQPVTVSHGIFVNPLSLQDGDQIKLIAKFRSISGPHAPYDPAAPNAPSPGSIPSLWFVGIQLRAGPAAADTDGGLSRVSVTLQHNLSSADSVNGANPGFPARLNSPGNGVPKLWLNATDYDEIFGQKKAFELEMTVYLRAGGSSLSCALSIGGRVVTDFGGQQFSDHQASSAGAFKTAGAAVGFDNADAPLQNASVVIEQFDIFKWV